MQKSIFFLHLLFILVLAGSSCYAQQDTLFFDDFLDNHNKWDVYTDKITSIAIENGHLKIESTREPQWYFIYGKEIEQIKSDSFVYEIQFRFTHPGQFGIAYDIKDPKNYRCFGVNHHQYFAYRYANSTFLSSHAKVHAVNKDVPIVLQVACVKDIYSFWVNGEKVYFNKSLPVTETSWGFVIKGHAKVVVDYVLIRSR